MAVGYCLKIHPSHTIRKMAISLEEVREILKAPKNKSSLSKAARHEDRLRFHTETYMDQSEASAPVTTFLDWVRTLIPKDKFKIFLSLFRFPLSTVELTSKIYEELERVFDGKNPSYSFQFTDSTYRDDWEYYRSEHLKEPKVWRTKGWKAMKSSINSILVVDLPEEQKGEYPEPYFYFLDIRNVIDFSLKDGKVEWLIFRQHDGVVTIFDDETYRKVRVIDNKIEEVIVDKAHDLGFCPAAFFWTSDLNHKSEGVKKSPLSSQLSQLDWLLFFSTSKKHLDLYAPYPIYSAFEADCDFENNETGEYCDGGYLRNSDNNFMVHRDGSVLPCPVCSSKRLAGVGSYIEVPIPTKDDPDLRNPVSITSIDKDSLDYNVEEVKRLEASIFNAVVGSDGAAQQNKSLNELQVSSNFESRTSVLNNIKVNFENAKKFVDDTCCKLRYGSNFIGSSISMGTQFYIYSVDDLYAMFDKAKKNGASDYILDSISDQIVSTEYKNDPIEMQRMLTLKHLEPYRHYTLEDLLKLSDKNMLDEKLFQIKINFSTFIDRFERENTDIVEFGSQLDFNRKITIISDKLKEYANLETNPQIPGSGNSSQRGS